MKFCADCAHKNGRRCSRSSKTETSLVSGMTLIVDVRECQKERSTNFVLAYILNRCGSQGRFFS